MADIGTVYLVGAGPGDPGLFTIRGMECLAKADVVIYDNLAATVIKFAPESAEIIYVGKKAGDHAMKQDDINQLLADKAKEGHTVVRLKGGDPFVFGRGAEEAIVLRKEGVPYEVVPGVTAGVAAPAYAGIPVTHRTCTSSVTFITGHEDPNKNKSTINWKSLAESGSTLVFYMGVRNLPGIAKKLIEAGMSPDSPVAVIRKGSFPTQQTVIATLSTVEEKIRKADIKPPAIAVIGDVVNLSSELSWYNKRPLFGKTIIVTRTRTQVSELAEQLENLGANVISFPTIRIEPADDIAPLLQAIESLSSFDWIIFTSTNGVDKFFTSLREKKMDSRNLASCRICAIGGATSEQLLRQGISADLVPERFTSNAVFDALNIANEISGKRYLLPRADIAGADLPARLKEAGADVTEVTSYKTVPAEPEPHVIDILKNKQADIVTFTSSSTARNFASLVSDVLGGLPEGVKYISIGPETSKAAREEKMPIAVEAEQHDINGLVRIILEHFGSKTT